MSEVCNVILFDFDGTLTKTDTTKFLIISLFSYRIRSIGKLIGWLCKRGLTADVLQNEKNKIIGELLRGCTLDNAEKRLWLFKLMVQWTQRKKMWNKLYNLKKKNYKIVIATASPSFAVKILFDAEILVIGTEYEVNEGRYSGKIAGKPCYGDAKAMAVKRFLADSGCSQALLAVSDHCSDIPLLLCARRAFLLKNSKLVPIATVRGVQ
jgi:HAD superfamily phosphoserine phosphatase-like hydrolase